MGLRTALTDNSFDIQPDGRFAYYPWGTFTHGYIIPWQQAERLRRWQWWLTLAGGFGVPLVGDWTGLYDSPHGWVMLGVLFGAVFVSWAVSVRWTLRSAERTSRGPRWRESAERYYAAVGWAWPVSPLGTLIALWLLIVGVRKAEGWSWLLVLAWAPFVCTSVVNLLYFVRWRWTRRHA